MKKSAHSNLGSNLDGLTINSIEFLLQKQRLEELLYEVCEAIVGIGPDFKITVFNKMAEAMTGIPAAEALGKPFNEIVKLTDAKGIITDLAGEFFSNVSKVIPNLVLKGRHHYNINLKMALIGDLKNPKECIVTLSDVTKEKELDQLKEELFSVASHELKTPITIIKSYLWMLQNQKGGPLTKKQEDYLSKAVNATNRILALVNDILSMSRIEQGRVEFDIQNIDLAKILQDIYTDFEQKAHDKNLVLTLDLAKKQLPVFADVEQTHEVLVNLVENAIKFTKSGEVRISTQLLKNEDKIKVSIIDTGVGIDKDDLPKLFRKFGKLGYSYQYLAEHKGTGLGLYIVKLYIQGMRGSVGAESKGKNKGSTFWFTLPTKPATDTN